MADILIYGKLKNQTTDNIIAGSDQLYDDSLQKFQSEINQDLQDSIQSSQTTIDNYTINGKKISENPILNKTDVGLGNVINEEQIPLSQKGIAGGIATLDDTGKLTGTQLPVDEEDITVNNGVLKLADRDTTDGMGYKILRLPENGILTQDQINTSNTIYEIRYDFNLNGTTITIPRNSILKFNGGSFSNGTINPSLDCYIDSPLQTIFKNNLKISKQNKFTNILYPEWFGAVKDGSECSQSLNELFSYADTYEIKSIESGGNYNISNSIVIPQCIKNIEFLGSINYTGEDYAIKFTCTTGRVKDVSIKFGNIYALSGGCIGFYPNSGNIAYVAGMILDGKVFQAANECIYIENNGWFNENKIQNINFTAGTNAIKIVNTQTDSTNGAISRLILNRLHIEGVKQGIYIDANGKNVRSLYFDNCRMDEIVENFTSMCNITNVDDPKLNIVQVVNQSVGIEYFIGEAIYHFTDLEGIVVNSHRNIRDNFYSYNNKYIYNNNLDKVLVSDVVEQENQVITYNLSELQYTNGFIYLRSYQDVHFRFKIDNNVPDWQTFLYYIRFFSGVNYHISIIDSSEQLLAETYIYPTSGETALMTINPYENQQLYSLISKSASPISPVTGNRTNLDDNMVGVRIFETSLNKPIWWNGTEWIDATGNNADTTLWTTIE